MSGQAEDFKYNTGSREVDNLYAQDDTFWRTYIKARPQVPQSFFDRIFAYHEQNGGKFDVVHDAGAGGGVHSLRLAKRFKKVIVSDPSDSNIEVAKRLLKGSQFEFHAEKLENASTIIPDNSVDMVFGATMMHWVKLDDGMRSVEKQLKSNGTFVAWHAAFPRFPSDLSVETAWDNIVHRGMAMVFSLSDKTTSLPPAMEIGAFDYDTIELSTETFKSGVQRVKINNDKEIPGDLAPRMYLLPELRKKFPYRSSFEEHDKIVFENSEEWTFNADIDQLTAMLKTYPADYESEQLKPLLTKLQEEMPPGKVVHATWPVALIMASKR